MLKLGAWLGPPVLIFAAECSTAEIFQAVLKNRFYCRPNDLIGDHRAG
jgi:hypothetical protein